MVLASSILDLLRKNLRPLPVSRWYSELNFQTEVTFPAFLISFFLSVVLLIITRALSLLWWTGPGKIFLYDLTAEAALIAMEITDMLFAFYMSHCECIKH